MPGPLLDIIADGAADAEDSTEALLEQYRARFYAVLNDPTQRGDLWELGLTAQGLDPAQWMGLTPRAYNQLPISQRTPMMDAALAAVVGLAYADANYTVLMPVKLKGYEAQAKKQNQAARRLSLSAMKGAAMEGPRERFAQARERIKAAKNAGQEPTVGG